ncbi:hypothetical protein [Virgisporangium aurantiacum]|uniref:hypothetical protein n=1 Tax=Virgisporangium aurantiacum TaxID=175570 RepID=UPI00194F0FF9|nr:hypothetical protein [Virgisporangium aurantiacum]
MGYSTVLFMLDMNALATRVLPALRDWVVDSVVADWWQDALCVNRVGTLPALDYLFAADLDAAGDPAVLLDPVGLHLAIDDHPDAYTLRVGIEVAVLSAATGEAFCFTKGNLTHDLADPEVSGAPYMLTPPPRPGDRLTDLIARLDGNLVHLRHSGGGWGEGLRGMLDAAATADLDDALAAHGSTPATGTAAQVLAACDAVDYLDGWRRDSALALAVQSVARQARGLGHGLLNVRDPRSQHLGSWANGILQRATSPQP